MSKPVVCVSYISYVVSMAQYFVDALLRRDDIEVFTVAPFFSDWIPWSGGITLPYRYVKTPNLPLPRNWLQNPVPFQMVEKQLPEHIDLFLEIDAGFHFINKPKADKVALIETDPHCVSGDTLLATNRGFLYAYEAENSKISGILDDTGFVSCEDVIFSGYKPTRKILVEHGYEIVCTDDHKFYIDGEYKQAKDLKKGDYLPITRGKYSSFVDGDSVSYSIGFVIGAFQGDGSFGSSDIIKFTIGTEKKAEFGKAIEFHLSNGFGIETVTRGKHYTNENTTILQVRRWGLHRFLKSINIKSGNIPQYIRCGSDEIIAGYIAGLFSADGCSVEGKLQLTTKWEQISKELQNILLYYGILSRRKMITTGESAYKPGEHYWTIYINGGRSTELFRNFVGYIPGRPIYSFGHSRCETDYDVQQYKIIEVSGAIKNYPKLRSPEPVYDVVNCSNSRFLANGFIVHNCLGQHYAPAEHYSDIVFGMQSAYLKREQVYLPYAVDDHWFYPEQREIIHDACLIGLHYPQRDQLVNELRSTGKNVYYDIGVVYDEYRHKYNESKIALSWSSLNDTPVRVFEALGMARNLVANRTPDLMHFFKDGEHFIGFDNVQQAKDATIFLLENPDKAEAIRLAGYKAIIDGRHTFDHRVQYLLEKCEVI